MPDGSFPNISNPAESTQENTAWGVNAEERMLAYQGRTQPRQGEWLRKISLIVYGGSGGGDAGNGIELNNMKINFEVTKTTVSSPNILYAKIYNLSRNSGPATEEKIKQYSRVQLAAGYQTDNYGMIFDGKVAMYIQGKENPTDTYLEIFAGDGDDRINSSVTVLTWPAGTPPSQKIKDHIAQMGVQQGEVNVGKGEQPSLRSSSYCGMSWKGIRDQCNATQSDFFVDDGVAHVISWSGYRSGEVCILSPTTGLVNIPKVTPQGIEADCLLNPKLRIAGLVKIDTSLLSGVQFIPGGGMNGVPASQGYYAGQAPVSTMGAGWGPGAGAISPSGIYKILQLKHYGDTRGNPWYSTVICGAAGAGGELLPNTIAGTALNRSQLQPPTPGAPPIPPVPVQPPLNPATDVYVPDFETGGLKRVKR